MIDKKIVFLALISMLLVYAYLIPAVQAAVPPSYLKVIEAPQRPKYNELPGFSVYALIIAIAGIAAFYLSKRKNRKAISPVVATILLIALTIAAFVIIFAWTRGFISEQVEKLGGPVATACNSVSFNAVLSDNNAYITNTGNIVLYGFNVKGETAGTSKLAFKRTNSGKIGAGEADVLDLSSIIPKYDTVTLIPVLLGKGTNSGAGKLYPCEAQTRVIKPS